MSKIYCFYCLRLNLLEKSEFKHGEFQYRFSRCPNINHIVNSVHSKAINYFKISKRQLLIHGQPIKYTDCKKYFKVLFALDVIILILLQKVILFSGSYINVNLNLFALKIL